MPAHLATASASPRPFSYSRRLLRRMRSAATLKPLAPFARRSSIMRVTSSLVYVYLSTSTRDRRTRQYCWLEISEQASSAAWYSGHLDRAFNCSSNYSRDMAYASSAHAVMLCCEVSRAKAF